MKERSGRRRQMGLETWMCFKPLVYFFSFYFFIVLMIIYTTTYHLWQQLHPYRGCFSFYIYAQYHPKSCFNVILNIIFFNFSCFNSPWDELFFCILTLAANSYCTFVLPEFLCASFLKILATKSSGSSQKKDKK